MSDALREAARRALEKLGSDGGGGEVTRLTVDVAIDGRSELVTLALRGGELVWSSTAGEGPHVSAALRWLASSAEAAPGVRVGEAPEPAPAAPRVTWPPGEPDQDAEARAARGRLAEALEDVVTVVVRAGVGAVESPSVADSLERLRREAPLPTPMGLSRWLGRLKTALDGGDVELVARLLDGAAQLAADLRRDKPSAEVRRRVVGWLGGGADVTAAVERLSDRVLVEIAREQLPSSERGGIERRHLVDLSDGEVFREERTRTSPVASVGPCPRVINVGLAEVEEGASPRRIRLMQYAVSLELGRAELERIEANAYRRFAALADRYRALIDAQPGQAEPFAVVAPRAFEHGAGALCRDDEGQPLPFARADDPSALDVLERMCPPSGPR